ncbi:MAG: hypothetical protein WCO29_24655 [Nostocales cyanobacterium ELA583]
MQTPSFFYGIYKDVTSDCRKMVTGHKRGQAWNKLINSNSLLVAR